MLGKSQRLKGITIKKGTLAAPALAPITHIDIETLNKVTELAAQAPEATQAPPQAPPQVPASELINPFDEFASTEATAEAPATEATPINPFNVFNVATEAPTEAPTEALIEKITTLPQVKRTITIKRKIPQSLDFTPEESEVPIIAPPPEAPKRRTIIRRRQYGPQEEKYRSDRDKEINEDTYTLDESQTTFIRAVIIENIKGSEL